MYKEILKLIKKFTPKLNVIKDAKGETLTENDDILVRWKEYCERCVYEMWQHWCQYNIL